MSHELLEQIKDCKHLRVINNPLIKALLNLSPEQQETITELLTNDGIVLWDEENRVNQLSVLPYLWPYLTSEQKKGLIPCIRPLFKEQGLKILDLLPKEDIDFIFTDYDLNELGWEWEAIQALIASFSDEEQSQHMSRYFKSYMRPFSEAKWQDFLENNSAEACYWIFMHLHLNDFKVFFERIDFLFHHLLDEHKVAILQRVDSNFIFKHIEKYKNGFLWEKFGCFLKKFSSEYRTKVTRHLTPQQISIILDTSLYLRNTLELFPEEDRLGLLLYLEQEFLEKICFDEKKDDGSDLSYKLYTLCEMLPPNHRILFLKSVAPAYLRLMNDDWRNIANIIDRLTPEGDAIFFEHVGYDVIQQFITKKTLESAINELRKEKRLGFLCLIRKLFPELFDEVFIKKKNVKAVVNFKNIILLLPKEHYFSFFELFSETDLEQFYQLLNDYGYEKIGAKLKQYLDTQKTNHFSSKNTMSSWKLNPRESVDARKEMLDVQVISIEEIEDESVTLKVSSSKKENMTPSFVKHSFFIENEPKLSTTSSIKKESLKNDSKSQNSQKNVDVELSSEKIKDGQRKNQLPSNVEVHLNQQLKTLINDILEKEGWSERKRFSCFESRNKPTGIRALSKKINSLLSTEEALEEVIKKAKWKHSGRKMQKCQWFFRGRHDDTNELYGILGNIELNQESSVTSAMDELNQFKAKF